MLGRQTEFTEAVGAPGQVVPKRPAGLSVSPITRSETNLDMNVEESGPVHADEFDPDFGAGHISSLFTCTAWLKVSHDVSS